MGPGERALQELGMLLLLLLLMEAGVTISLVPETHSVPHPQSGRGVLAPRLLYL